MGREIEIEMEREDSTLMMLKNLSRLFIGFLKKYLRCISYGIPFRIAFLHGYSTIFLLQQPW